MVHQACAVAAFSHSISYLLLEEYKSDAKHIDDSVSAKNFDINRLTPVFGLVHKHVVQISVINK